MLYNLYSNINIVLIQNIFEFTIFVVKKARYEPERQLIELMFTNSRGCSLKTRFRLIFV